MIEELLEPLVSERFRTDERYRKGHISIVSASSGRRILGVHIPEMKALAKKLAAGPDCIRMLEEFDEVENKAAAEGLSSEAKRLSHEEMSVWGFMINCMKCTFEQRLEYVKKFVPHIDNWAVCDSFCSSAKWASKNKDALWEYLCSLFGSDREFEVRFAVVMCLSYYLDEQWLPRVFFRLDSLDFGPAGSNYYVRMGVAWLLATALAKFPDDTRAWLRHCRLPEDVLKLYVRKVRESFRTRDVRTF